MAHQSSGKGEIEDAWQASYKTAAGEHLQMQLQHRVRDGTGNVLDLSGLGIEIP